MARRSRPIRVRFLFGAALIVGVIGPLTASADDAIGDADNDSRLLLLEQYQAEADGESAAIVSSVSATSSASTTVAPGIADTSDSSVTCRSNADCASDRCRLVDTSSMNAEAIYVDEELAETLDAEDAEIVASFQNATGPIEVLPDCDTDCLPITVQAPSPPISIRVCDEVAQ